MRFIIVIFILIIARLLRHGYDAACHAAAAAILRTH